MNKPIILHFTDGKEEVFVMPDKILYWENGTKGSIVFLADRTRLCVSESLREVERMVMRSQA